MKVTNLGQFFEDIKGLPKPASHQILTEAVRNLFNTVGPEDILKIEGKKMFFQDRELDPTETNRLIEEAKLFRSSKLWKVLQADLKYQANKRMFLESQSIDDLVAGKLLLLYIDIVNTRLAKLK